MSRTAPKKCITCSQLSAAEAQELHGTDGDRCWHPKVCYFRRSYYKNRQTYIENRWQRRHPEASRATTAAAGADITVPLPDYPVAMLVLTYMPLVLSCGLEGNLLPELNLYTVWD